MDPITITVANARHALGIGTTKIYELIASERLRAVKIGRRTLITTESIRALIQESATAVGE